MRNSIKREQQLYVVSRPMGHASHECNVYAKDKRLGHAIFGLWMDSSALVGAPRKLAWRSSSVICPA